MVSERKHVRFDFTSTSLSPPPTSAKEVNKRRSSPESSPSRRFGFSPPNFIFAINHVSRRKQRQNKKGVLKNVQTEYKAVLSTSRTFPMSENEMMEEFGEDFVPRSYVAAVEKVRRMSLKDYSGLDSPNSKININSSVSPLLGRMQRTSLASAPHSPCINLLDRFSDRRRSSAGMSRGPYCDAYADPSEPSDSRLSYALYEDGENQKLHFLHDNNLDFGAIHERLKEIRNRLTGSLEKVPNESPRRKQTVDTEKVTMLNECRRLAAACKNMVRSASLNPSSSNSEWRYTVVEAVECADRVTSIVETVLRKSNSVFQAQLMTAKTSQMLKALAETLIDLEKAYGAPKFGKEAKQLIRSSTTLAATLTQLIQTVRSL
uniref:Uncharacterized protein n=1 Tax=Acrobeloides nanus TaxID=290746 RepID=A0A914EGU6_9BILA